MKRHKIIFFIFVAAMLFEATFASAAALTEINYPRFPGAEAPQDFIKNAPAKDVLPLYIKYIFNALVWLCGITAVFIFIIAGIRFLTSSGKPEAMAKAREQISSAFFGILILLSSVLILRTINPKIIAPEIPPLKPIETIEIPPELSQISPPPLAELRSLISTEIPFGRIIQKIIFERQDQVPPAKKSRMDRIKDIATTTLDLATKLRSHAVNLNNLKNGCACDNARPLCPGCSPTGGGGANAALGAIIGAITGAFGAENLGVALNAVISVADVVNNPAQLNSVMNNLQGIAGAASGAAQLDGIFGAVGQIAGVAMTNPTNISGLLGSVNSLTQVWGVDLSGAFGIIDPIQGIIDNPNNLSGILGSVDQILGTSGLDTGLDLSNIGGVNVLNIAGYTQGILENPTNIGGVLGSVNQILGVNGLDTGVNLSNISGINVLNIGNSVAKIINNPSDIGQVLNNLNQITTNLPGAFNLDLTNVAGSGFNVINIGNAAQTIIANPTDLGGIRGAINEIGAEVGISANISNAINNALFIAEPVGAIIKDPSINNISSAVRSISLRAGLPASTTVEINNALNIIGPIGDIAERPTLVTVSSAIKTIASRAGYPNLDLADVPNAILYINVVINDPSIDTTLGVVKEILIQTNATMEVIDSINRAVLYLADPVRAIKNDPTNIVRIMDAVSQISTRAGGPSLDSIANQVAPIQNIINDATNRNFGNLFSSVNQLTLNFGVDLRAIEIGNLDINLVGIMQPIQGIISNAESRNIAGLVQSANQITSGLGIDLADINIGNTNVLGVLNPITGIITGAQSGDVGVLINSVNQMTANFGVNLANINIGGTNIVAIMQPLTGIISNVRSGNIPGMLASINQITGGFGVNLTSFPLPGGGAINLIGAIQPFQNLIGNPTDLNNIRGALDVLSSFSPVVSQINTMLGDFQNIAGIVSNPADLAQIMDAASAFAAISPTNGALAAAFGQLAALSPVMGGIGGMLGGLTPGSCTCDPCRPVAGNMQTEENKAIEEIALLIQEQQKSTTEIRLIKEEVGKLERAEKFMLECPLGNLESLPEFYTTQDDYFSKKWLVLGMSFWEKILLENDWASFYCSVSGTIWEEKPLAESFWEELEKELSETASLEPTSLNYISSCTTEIPVGEIFDRSERLGYKLSERLATLINLDKDMITAAQDMFALISQCTSQKPRCMSICVDKKHGGCDEYCVGNPCPDGAIQKQLDKITKILEGVGSNSPNVQKTQEGIRDVTTGVQRLPVNAREQIGITTIINNIVPSLLSDLATKVREPMKTCVTKSFDIETIGQEPQAGLADCESGKGEIGPNGKTMQECCYQEDWYKDCLQQCYLEGVSRPPLSAYDNYKKCLTTCQKQKASERNVPEIATCRHNINFYCCTI